MNEFDQIKKLKLHVKKFTKCIMFEQRKFVDGKSTA